MGVLEEDLADPEQFVSVEGAALFAEGDEVLLADDEPNKLERAQVTGARPNALRLRSHGHAHPRLQAPAVVGAAHARTEGPRGRLH